MENKITRTEDIKEVVHTNLKWPHLKQMNVGDCIDAGPTDKRLRRNLRAMKHYHKKKNGLHFKIKDDGERLWLCRI